MLLYPATILHNLALKRLMHKGFTLGFCEQIKYLLISFRRVCDVLLKRCFSAGSCIITDNMFRRRAFLGQVIHPLIWCDSSLQTFQISSLPLCYPPSVAPFTPSPSASFKKGRCCLATYMYRSSDSLLTRTSLILSIFKSSPSMSSTVMVESAMDTTSSSGGRGWCRESRVQDH